jgi:HK97 family phage major capsid protein
MKKDSKIESQYKALIHLINTKTSAGLGEDGSAAALTYLEILKDILSATYLTGSIYDLTWKVDVSDRANGIKLPTTDQVSRSVEQGILGGVITYPIEEGVDITPSIPKFTSTDLPINQVAVLCRATNALIQDSTVLPQYLRKGFEDAIRMRLDHSIIYGDGADTCYGVAGSTAIGTRATLKVTLANPYTVANLKTMMSAYYGGKDGVWVMAKDAWNEIFDLYSNSTNPILPLHFTDDHEGRTKALLYGYPVVVCDFMNSRDIVLGDFSAYLIDQKPLREDFSEHLYFSSNETAFRSIIRYNGAPIWNSPIKEKSGQLSYCYVASIHSDSDVSSSSSSEDITSSSSSKSSMQYSSSSSKSNSSSSSSSSSSKSVSSLSSNSSSSSSSSSSSYNVRGCVADYCASTFATVALNGTWAWDEVTEYNNMPVYVNGANKVWFDTHTGYWAMSNDAGDPENQWLSSKDTAGGCPDGTWAGEAGTLAEGAC